MELKFNPKEFVRASGNGDIKDPCPVFDGIKWHVYSSLCNSKKGRWKIFHAVSDDLEGNWSVLEPVELVGVTEGRVGAPGVVYDSAEKIFHMFLQSDFMEVGSWIYHLISSDGNRFEVRDISLRSELSTPEASIYDPHPAIINGRKYLTYSGATRVGSPDIFLAQSETDSWSGPWKKLGVILSHEEVSHHNQHDHKDYEWGLEGSQLIELPDKRVLLNAVCFLPYGRRGTRQRVFFAVGDTVTGPFRTLGPVIEPPTSGWNSGENGHATGIIKDRSLVLFYQARSKSKKNSRWRCGFRYFPEDEIKSSNVFG